MRRIVVLVLLLLPLNATWGQKPPAEPPKESHKAKSLTPKERTALAERAVKCHREGLRLYKVQKLREAEQQFRDAVQLWRQLYSDGHRDLAASLNNLADLLQVQGKLTEAEALYRETLAMHRQLFCEKDFANGHPDLAASLNNLGHVLQAQGKLMAAEPLFRDALAMRRRLFPEKQFPRGHLDLAQSLDNLAFILRKQVKPAEAEPLCREAVAMYRRLFAEKEFPRGHSTMALSLSQLASVLQDQGKLSEAEPLFREALSMRRRLHPPEQFPRGHAGLVNGLNNLVFVLVAQRRLSDAELLVREALAMCRLLYPDKDFPRGHSNFALTLNNLAFVLESQGKLSEAEALHRDTLVMRRRLFPETGFPKGHPALAQSLNNLAFVLNAQMKMAETEPLYRDALAMRRRLFPETEFPRGHPDLAESLNNLAYVLRAQGKFTETERRLREALAMCRRLFPEREFPRGHPLLVQGLNNLAMFLTWQKKLTEAESLCREALAMYRQQFPEDEFPVGHPNLAVSLNNLAFVLNAAGKFAETEALCREAVGMNRRLFPKKDFPRGDPNLALSLNNLAGFQEEQGNLADAESLYREAVAICRRLFPEKEFPSSHYYLAGTMANLASVLWVQGKPSKAEPVHREALAMYRRLATDFAMARTEGEALNYLAMVPRTLDAYLSHTSQTRAEGTTTYSAVWDAKASLSRVFERRHLAARAATASPKAKERWEELASLRRQRADLLFAEQPSGPLTRKDRDETLEKWARRIDDLNRELRSLLPELARAQDLVAKPPAELQKALAADAAFVDFFRYTRFEFDPKKPGKKGEKRTESYTAFVVTSKTITRVELGPAGPIEKNLALWREAIQDRAAPEPPADLPLALRGQVWEKVEKHLPPGAKTVYISPAGPLAFLPWAALPGKEPGTVLLEDYALAVAPSAPFLLDKLTAPEVAAGPGRLLAIGGVRYDLKPDGPLPAPLLAQRGPAAGEGKPLVWKALPGTAAELARVTNLAGAAKVPVTPLTGVEPSVARLVADLPKYRYAHLATHGFFADAEFRTRQLKVDESLFMVSGRERVGPGALSPFLLSGVVCAGANVPDTPSRGLLTAEALLNADLSGMDLAVLSACETGLGDVAGGQGLFGLQLGFHVAGCRDVVASLWKVDDEATAALMALFYRNLWEKKLAPIEALRRAQLAIRGKPGLIPGLARGERGKFEEADLPPIKPKAPAVPSARVASMRQWAAFTLSGPGRRAALGQE